MAEMKQYLKNISRETSLDVFDYLDNTDKTILINYFDKYLISKQELRDLNAVITEFKCNCNKEYCPECAFKEFWKDLGLNDNVKVTK